MSLGSSDSFVRRHIGPTPAERDAMLRTLGVRDLDALVDEAIPADIRLRRPLALPPGESEFEYLQHLRRVAAENRVFRSYIGMGYYGCITPPVIQRGILENPGWYTPYTPYQAEIAQGRLEALLIFQTMVTDLTGMEVATASLLDEATAAAEAMAMLYRIRARARSAGRVLLIVGSVFPQTLAVLRGRAEPLGLELRQVPFGEQDAFGPDVFGLLVQSPDDDGVVRDLGPLVAAARAQEVRVAVATDLLSLTLLKPPGEFGADVVVGSAQRFGVPMGYGGPHAAFFATRMAYVRQTPGRLIGVSVDARGRPAYRMALQTREQHIRREKATSNICTAQALLANVAAMYAVYHGPDGLRGIAARIHRLAQELERALVALGCDQLNPWYFDTLKIELPGDGRAVQPRVRAAALERGINFRYFDDGRVGVALDEMTGPGDVADIVEVFARALERPAVPVSWETGPRPPRYPEHLVRTSPYLTHPVFHAYRSETEMLRYLRRLERKDVGLDTSMIPLGSCTMKLNAAAEMLPLTWPEFAQLHPFAPVEQAAGYARIFRELEAALGEITGLPAVSLQPNSGAQGELAGLLIIRAYHRDRGEPQRDVVLIPASAHGTNPASATMAGFKVVIVACDKAGNVDLGDLRAKAEAHREHLAALMITYPSTHGVFEERIREITAIVHAHGGQVYLDGANLNAQVGLTSPAAIGADVCHLNLHKTFAIPHGGGGPGAGPIAVAAHLAAYLPGHPVVPTGGPRAIAPVAAAPWGSASILVVSYGYLRLLGGPGLTEVSKYAILNANYLKARLAPYYPVLYSGPNGRVAHEVLFDLRGFRPYGIDEMDIAKRLMDYGFHAPTVSFPVPGTLMVEPTESESKAELDRFCAALIAIRQEIQDIIEGRADPQDNVLKNAPHTVEEAVADRWSHPYSREHAVFPLPFVRARKVWPSVARIDQAYGDRHLVCVCPPAGATEDDVSVQAPVAGS